MHRLVALVGLFALIGGLCACAQTVVFRSGIDGELMVDGESWGDVPPDGVVGDLPRGLSDVEWQIVDDTGSVLAEGAVARRLSLKPLVLGIVGAALCVPSCAALGLLAANPLLWLLPAVLLGGSTALVTTTALAPGWLTLPLVVAGAACGTAPLCAWGWAEPLPDIVYVGLDVPPVAPEPGDVAF